MESGIGAEALQRDRFSVFEVHGEGLLLNRESGALYRLNRTGHAIWAAFLGGDSAPKIATQLHQRFGIDLNQALTDTLTILSYVPDKPAKIRSEQFRWARMPDGYGFFEGDDLVCQVEHAGAFLRLGTAQNSHPQSAWVYLKSVMPKVLALRGIFVLHGSAVQFRDWLLVFSGPSGAGKTTCAKIFAKTGAELIAEDLLIFAPYPHHAEVMLGGEKAIHAWVAEQSRFAINQPSQPIDCVGLNSVLGGARRKVTHILFLDQARRAGATIQSDAVAGVDAVLELMDNVFFASTDSDSWTTTFDRLQGIERTVKIARAIMPSGLGDLETAVRAFT